MSKNSARIIGAFDFETDPFLFNREPEPFSWGATDGENYEDYFAETASDCVSTIITYFRGKADTGNKYRYYAHNGGRFDFFFLLEHIDPDIRLINGRIAECTLFDGAIELRDSYCILPLSLSTHGKLDIEYEKMERPVRHLHKHEILRYQRYDVDSLYDWVIKFTDQFGHKLTLASTAFQQLSLTGYDLPKTYKSFDEIFRPFYYGGRVQCFEVGAIEEDLEYIDINSAYPHAMTFKHPFGNQFVERLSLPKDGKLKGSNGAYFAIIKARNQGCLPFRGENARLYFPDDDLVREYFATGWEIQAGLETKTLEIVEVIKVYDFIFTEDFREYVFKWYAIKNECKQNGDSTGELFAKFMLNSAYGKFGQNGEDFEDYKIMEFGERPQKIEATEAEPEPAQWLPYATTDSGHEIYSRANPSNSYYNVATAASITGFVRALMWRSINSCERPLYCDTDSIICKKFNGAVSDKLGDWKVEGYLQAAYIAQRKMYAVHLKDGSWKKACKGVRLEAEQIKDAILDNKVIHQDRDAPSFNLKYGARFTSRKTDFTNLEKNLLTNPA